MYFLDECGDLCKRSYFCQSSGASRKEVINDTASTLKESQFQFQLIGLHLL